jgi:hypothetical protein
MEITDTHEVGEQVLELEINLPEMEDIGINELQRKLGTLPHRAAKIFKAMQHKEQIKLVEDAVIRILEKAVKEKKKKVEENEFDSMF